MQSATGGLPGVGTDLRLRRKKPWIHAKDFYRLQPPGNGKSLKGFKESNQFFVFKNIDPTLF